MRRKTVFILEDDHDIRELITYILVEEGYDVSEYPTAKEFNEMIVHTVPDLFVLDILLPDGNGIAICKELKADSRTSEIPVLLMSANQNRQAVIAETCAEDFISKPFDIKHLMEHVKHFAG